jgi:cytochrome c peroxidase
MNISERSLKRNWRLLIKKTNKIILYAFIIIAAAAMPAAASAAGGLMPVPPGVLSPEHNPTTVGKVELGKKLFFDRRLSGDGTMSCASCHMPGAGFADNLPISLNYPTTRNWRNSPTLINVAYSASLFHDGRASTLEEQALFPMMSAFEMNQNLDYLEEEIRGVPGYVEAFRNVFGGGVTRERIAMAMAAFERTLVSRNSPLDLYLKGDRKALSSDAGKGLRLFEGKAGCVRCHRGVNLSDGSFHNLEVPDNELVSNDPRTLITVRFVAKVSGYEDYERIREDHGRLLVTRDKGHWKAFRTPSLREVSRTAPYMHNGAIATIEDVVEFYDRGGGKGNTAGLKPLGLSNREKEAIAAFLREALTGDEIVLKYPEIP